MAQIDVINLHERIIEIWPKDFRHCAPTLKDALLSHEHYVHAVENTEPKVWVIAESPARTAPEILGLSILPEYADRLKNHFHPGHNNLVHCLSYGEDWLIRSTKVKGEKANINTGTPVFWKLLSVLSGATNAEQLTEENFSNVFSNLKKDPNKKSLGKRLDRKIQILDDMGVRGIALIDLSPVSIYLGAPMITAMNKQGKPYKTPAFCWDSKDQGKILSLAWELYMKPMLAKYKPKSVLVLGQRIQQSMKDMSETLEKGGIEYLGTFPHPSGRSYQGRKYIPYFQQINKVVNAQLARLQGGPVVVPLSTGRDAVVVPSSTESDADVVPSSAERDDVVVPLSTEGDAVVVPLSTEGDADVAPSSAERDDVVVPLSMERDADVKPLRTAREAEVVSVSTESDADVGPLPSDSEAEVVSLPTNSEGIAVSLSADTTRPRSSPPTRSQGVPAPVSAKNEFKQVPCVYKEQIEGRKKKRKLDQSTSKAASRTKPPTESQQISASASGKTASEQLARVDKKEVEGGQRKPKLKESTSNTTPRNRSPTRSQGVRAPVSAKNAFKQAPCVDEKQVEGGQKKRKRKQSMSNTTTLCTRPLSRSQGLRASENATPASKQLPWVVENYKNVAQGPNKPVLQVRIMVQNRFAARLPYVSAKTPIERAGVDKSLDMQHARSDKACEAKELEPGTKRTLIRSQGVPASIDAKPSLEQSPSVDNNKNQHARGHKKRKLAQSSANARPHSRPPTISQGVRAPVSAKNVFKQAPCVDEQQVEGGQQKRKRKQSTSNPTPCNRPEGLRASENATPASKQLPWVVENYKNVAQGPNKPVLQVRITVQNRFAARLPYVSAKTPIERAGVDKSLDMQHARSDKACEAKELEPGTKRTLIRSQGVPASIDAKPSLEQSPSVDNNKNQHARGHKKRKLAQSSVNARPHSRPPTISQGVRSPVSAKNVFKQAPCVDEQQVEGGQQKRKRKQSTSNPTPCNRPGGLRASENATTASKQLPWVDKNYKNVAQGPNKPVLQVRIMVQNRFAARLPYVSAKTPIEWAGVDKSLDMQHAGSDKACEAKELEPGTKRTLIRSQGVPASIDAKSSLEQSPSVDNNKNQHARGHKKRKLAQSSANARPHSRPPTISQGVRSPVSAKDAFKQAPCVDEKQVEGGQQKRKRKQSMSNTTTLCTRPPSRSQGLCTSINATPASKQLPWVDKNYKNVAQGPNKPVLQVRIMVQNRFAARLPYVSAKTPIEWAGVDKSLDKQHAGSDKACEAKELEPGTKRTLIRSQGVPASIDAKPSLEQSPSMDNNNKNEHAQYHKKRQKKRKLVQSKSNTRPHTISPTKGVLAAVSAKDGFMQPICRDKSHEKQPERCRTKLKVVHPRLHYRSDEVLASAPIKTRLEQPCVKQIHEKQSAQHLQKQVGLAWRKRRNPRRATARY